MSSTNKTSALGLSQWVLSDPFRMEDFNADNAKIDAAVAAVPYVKLLNVTTNAAATQVDLDLSGIDLSQFSKLEIVASLNSPAATSRTSSIYMLINGNGAYLQGSGSALEAKGYVATCPVLENTWNSTMYWSTLHAELFGLTVPTGIDRYIGVHALGIGAQYGNRYALQSNGLIQLSASNAGIRTINFVGADGIANIGAGAKFYIYGVRA